MYQLNQNLRNFWRTRARYKVLYGGRASGKSHDAAGFAVYLAANFKLKFLCARQFQNRIAESVYTLIKDKIEASEFNGEFEFTNTSIRHLKTGAEFLFYGIARNLSEIKSTEGVDILWLEEAHYVNQEQWNVIEPTIRKKGSQIWLIFNPDEYMDFVYQNFVVSPPEDADVRMMNWEENPYLSETMLKVISDAYKKDPKNAEHVYGGIPHTGGDKSVINLAYILAALNAHKHETLGWEVEGARVLGFDVADDGGDTNANVGVHGNVINFVDEWNGLEDELLKSATRTYNAAKLQGAEVNFDSIGVGAHVGAKFKELNLLAEEKGETWKMAYSAFNAGGAVENPDETYMELPHTKILNRDHFSNIKAQKWDEVATRFRKTYEYIKLGVKHPTDELVSIDTAAIPKKLVDKLCQELAMPRKDTDGNGRFKVESKKEMAKRGLKSPNVADAVIMGLIRPKRAAAGWFDM